MAADGSTSNMLSIAVDDLGTGLWAGRNKQVGRRGLLAPL